MTLSPSFVHRKSLTLAISTLMAVFLLGLLFDPVGEHFRPRDEAVYIRAGVVSGFALLVCSLAWINLVRDVERGYAPWRCSLAAVLLLGATIGPVLVVVFAARHLLFK